MKWFQISHILPQRLKVDDLWRNFCIYIWWTNSPLKLGDILNLIYHFLDGRFLTGNPCSDWGGYRKFVITELPHLKVSLQFLVHEAFHFVLSCAFSNGLVSGCKIQDLWCFVWSGWMLGRSSPQKELRLSRFVKYQPSINIAILHVWKVPMYL